MSILIVGSEGSMGKRYQAILSHLGKNFSCVDLIHTRAHIDKMAYTSEGIIIASPTHTHLPYVQSFCQMKKPILCEKPLSTDPHEISEILNLSDAGDFPLTMMMQYQWLVNPALVGESYYDYFRHGADGIVWDCMQIIALAKKSVHLREKSPIWKCRINGYDLNVSHMDSAYVEYVSNWLKHPSQDLGYLAEIHSKVLEYEQRMADVSYH